MASRQTRLEWDHSLFPLGRHVNHDPRSLNFLVAEIDTPVSKSWRRYTPILDQGQLGSCTGNAMCGLLGTAPFYGSLYNLRHAYPPLQITLDEAMAVSIYSRATVIDPFDGSYPPTDTGSDGLSVTKVAIERKLITPDYKHITSLAAAHNAIKTGPFITGMNWYTNMFYPDSNGLIKIGGVVEGGHELAFIGYSATYHRWKFTQSWGTSWGKGGYGYMSDDTYQQLLSEQGDATVPTKWG